MVSTKSTLPNDEKEAQDSAYNPGEQAYREGMGSAYTGAGLDQLESFANDPANHDSSDKNQEDIKNAEEKGSATPDSGWNTDVKGQGNTKKSRFQQIISMTKKRGAIFGIAGILGVGGIFAGGFLGPASMLVSVMEGFTTANDSSSTAFERRFLKVFGYATVDDPVCAQTSRLIKCKMGRISNSALRKLEKKGVVAFDENGPMDTSKRGYPSKNPKGYTFVGLVNEDGRPRNVLAGDLLGYLANDPKMAASVLGTRGAFNLKVQAWSGKYLNTKFFKPFGIKKTGGIADGTNKGKAYKDVLTKVREKIPGLEKLGSVAAGVQAKVDKHLGSAKKGGAGYTIAVASCIGVKAPGYIAAGVAAVQLAQIMPIVIDVVLSPGGNLKASGVDPASTFNGDDMNAVGTLLTNQTPREGDGKMTSALDSPILLAAMGVNQNKPAVAAAVTPGFAILTSPAVLAANQADKALAPACNTIMSPAAMYSAMAVDAAVTVAASATIVGGIVKIIAGLAISEIAAKVVSQVAGQAAKDAIANFAKNDAITNAEGQAFGDVLGVSASSFFAAGGMSRSLPVLQTGTQLQEFAALKNENESFQRDMDIATLSPFDTSSKYTFLGSIVSNMHKAALASGSYNTGIVSMLSNAARLPFMSLNNNAGALTGFSESSCGYAADFGLDTTNPEDTPAINLAGLPCTGLTAEQAGMSTETAINLIQSEGWLDESKSIKDGSTITDLLKNGYIRADTPLSDYINTCSNPASGDYLFNAASCTIDSSTKNIQEVTDKINAQPGLCDEDEEDCIGSAGTGQVANGVKDARSLAAIPVFLLDFQSIQSINGEDVNTGKASDGESKAALAQQILDSGKVTFTEAQDLQLIQDVAAGSNDGNTFPCGVNIRVLNIIAAISAEHTVRINDLNRACQNSTAGGASSSESRHYAGNGSAIDFGPIDGNAAYSEAGATLIMQYAAPFLVPGSSVGQSNCSGAANLSVPEGVRRISDSCDHLHIDLPADSDENLQCKAAVYWGGCTTNAV